MRKSKAFTLAEVLITLVIIGVIAAMTIPTLMGNTNDKQKKVTLKKAFSAISQAVKLDQALYGTNFNCSTTSAEQVKLALKNHMSVIEDVDGWYFKTADGIMYWIDFGQCQYVWGNNDKQHWVVNVSFNAENPDVAEYDINKFWFFIAEDGQVVNLGGWDNIVYSD